MEQEVLKDKRLIKEEVTRRLVSGSQMANLEYDSLFNPEKASLNKDSEEIEPSFSEDVFYSLNEKLSGLTCDHTFRLSRQLLTQM